MQKKLLVLSTILFLLNTLIAQKAPIALNDTIILAENSSTNTILVTQNDTVYNGNVLNVTIAVSPSHGTTSLINGNQVNYVPNAFYYGQDLFTYSLCDSLNLCDTATVYITITGVNVPPVANSDTLILNDSVSTITLPLTANDHDPEGGPFAITGILNADSLLGIVSLDSGQVIFTRTPLSCGNSYFQYVECDTFNACDTASVYLSIECPDNIFKPQGFSPNGDGINDVLVFTNLEYFSPSSLKVLNRWGNAVYENDNYQNDWGGTNRNTSEALPDGTYFYVLTLPNKHKYTSYLIISRGK